jgi:hypothetical protein
MAQAVEGIKVEMELGVRAACSVYHVNQENSSTHLKGGWGFKVTSRSRGAGRAGP